MYVKIYVEKNNKTHIKWNVKNCALKYEILSTTETAIRYKLSEFQLYEQLSCYK